MSEYFRGGIFWLTLYIGLVFATLSVNIDWLMCTLWCWDRPLNQLNWLSVVTISSIVIKEKLCMYQLARYGYKNMPDVQADISSFSAFHCIAVTKGILQTVNTCCSMCQAPYITYTWRVCVFVWRRTASTEVITATRQPCEEHIIISDVISCWRWLK